MYRELWARIIAVVNEPQTDWAGLKTASGTAEGIPVALAALRSPDKEIRRTAYWRIDNHAVLQGDLYEAAPYVVRALLGCLRTTSVANVEVYELLAEFACGYAPEDQVATVDGSEQTLLTATKGELAKGMDLYWRDLEDPAVATRKRVAGLLLALSDEVDLDAARLRSALDREVDEEVEEVLSELLRDE